MYYVADSDMKVRWASGVYLAFTGAIFSNFFTRSKAFTVDVPAGRAECFTAVAGEGEEVFGNYEVLTEGDYKPVVVRVTGPESKQLYESTGKSEATFSFVADKGGSYELCIHNGTPEGGDDGVARVVGFSFRTDALVDEDIASEESIRRIIELGNQLTKGLSNLLDHQSYMRQREDAHAETMESISSKVLIWTVVEALVLIGVAVWQVVYISKFFEVKRMI